MEPLESESYFFQSFRISFQKIALLGANTEKKVTSFGVSSRKNVDVTNYLRSLGPKTAKPSKNRVNRSNNKKKLVRMLKVKVLKSSENIDKC